jgi:alkylation response protein AidB-like acyl-CoA dehydrogenase
VRAAALAGVDGTRKAATVTFTEAPARLLGRPGAEAADAMAGVIDRLLVGLVTDGVGAAEAVLELTVAYAKERVQFDKPIGAFQSVQHLCADMLQSLELARAGAYYALWAADGAAPGERHRAATMAKAFASDALFRVGAAAIQVFGGIGFTWEHDAHLFYKRLLTLQGAYGGATEHLEELAAIVLCPAE